MEHPTVGSLVKETTEQRKTFFNLIFGPYATGYVCIAFKGSADRKLEQHFFKWPEEQDNMLATITRHGSTAKHAYFCPQLFNTQQRKKETVALCPNAWADLDTCDPALLGIEPTVLIQSSPGRYQALWVFEQPLPANEAEEISQRIAYFHADHGADRSGWDLTQLLRIPYTPNVKEEYIKGDMSAPIVTILTANKKLYRYSDFAAKYPHIPAIKAAMDEALFVDDITQDPLELLQSYRSTLNPQAFELFHYEPGDSDDWSTNLWKLLRLCMEAGIPRKEAKYIAKHSACNKYARDNRPEYDLDKDVYRAYVKHLEEYKLLPTTETLITEIITEDEVRSVVGVETFIERYIKWASQLTDAAPQYHQAGAFLLLSAFMSGSITLPASFGNIIPNLWFMILGPTTITRKSVAMHLGIELIQEIDNDIMFATDGSVEGLLNGLSNRDGLPSVFYRDEFTGLITAMNNKDYMSDMPELLTKLYDGHSIKRLLRKEEIVVNRPILSLLGGGIKSKVQSLLTEEQIDSGFIPRFIFITAEGDMSRLRPVGPPVEQDLEWRDAIKNELLDIKSHYYTPHDVSRDGTKIGTVPRRFDARLTQDAWARYNEFETVMLKSALDTGLEYLLPVYDRLAKSTLKAAILISASRQRNNNYVIIDKKDLLHAIYYCRLWRNYASEVVNGVGKSTEERLLDRIFVSIKNTPGGVLRSELMRKMKLSAKRADSLFETLIQRNLIHKIKYGSDMRYFPLGG